MRNSTLLLLSLLGSTLLFSACSTRGTYLNRQDKLNAEDAGKVRTALETGNLPVLQSVFSKLNPDPEERSVGDASVLDSALATELNKGRSCNQSVVGYLIGQGATVSWGDRYRDALEKHQREPDRRSYNAVFCGNILKQIFTKKLSTQGSEESAADMIRGTHNNAVEFLNREMQSKDKDQLAKSIDVYRDFIAFAAGYSKTYCMKDATGLACANGDLFKKLSRDLPVKIQYQKTSKVGKALDRLIQTAAQ